MLCQYLVISSIEREIDKTLKWTHCKHKPVDHQTNLADLIYRKNHPANHNQFKSTLPYKLNHRR